MVIQISLIVCDDTGIIKFLKDHTLVDASFNSVSYYKFFLIIFLFFQSFIILSYYVAKQSLKKYKKNFSLLFKEKNIDVLFTMLAKALGLENQTRFTIFVSDPNNEKEMKILYRKHLGREKAEYSESLIFTDNEGLPGKAKCSPMILGKSNDDKESFLEKVLIHQLSPELPDIQDIESIDTSEIEKYKKYFKNQFNISEDKFAQLSNLKYKIKSYLSIGFMSHNYDKVAIVSIDSYKEDAFTDLELFKQLLKDGILTRLTFQKLLEKKGLTEVHEISIDQSLNADQICYHFIQIINLLHSIVYPSYYNREEQ